MLRVSATAGGGSPMISPVWLQGRRVRRSIRHRAACDPRGVESYSIKKLEPLYDFRRTVGLPDAASLLTKVQASLELGDFKGIGAEERSAVAGYNRDDCLSAWRLRDWLEKVRSQLAAAGAAIERPGPKSGGVGEDLTAWQEKIAGLVELLTQDVPTDRAQRSYEQHGRWLLDDRFHETDHGTGNLLADSSFVVDRTRSGIMAGWRASGRVGDDRGGD